jgi:hypothetical protein
VEYTAWERADGNVQNRAAQPRRCERCIVMATKQQRTIAELAAYERELMAELAKVRVEISERAGQVDPPKK